MLTVSQTIESIHKRLVRRSTLSSYIYIADSGNDFVVFAVNCLNGSDQNVLGRYTIAAIRSMNLQNRPTRYGFSTTFIKPKNREAIICGPSEVLVELVWLE